MENWRCNTWCAPLDLLPLFVSDYCSAHILSNFHGWDLMNEYPVSAATRMAWSGSTGVLQALLPQLCQGHWLHQVPLRMEPQRKQGLWSYHQTVVFQRGRSLSTMRVELDLHRQIHLYVIKMLIWWSGGVAEDRFQMAWIRRDAAHYSRQTLKDEE